MVFFVFLLLALLASFEFHRLASHKANPPALWIMLLATFVVQADFYFGFVELLGWCCSRW